MGTRTLLDAPTDARAARSQPGSDSSRSILAILAVASIAAILYVCFRDMERLVSRTFDDACYYFKIAQNLVQGHGVSFDGVHPTNGFQPLWPILLLPLFAVLQASPETMFRACLLFQIGLLALSAWTLDRALREFVSGRTRLLAMIAFIVLVFDPAINGMESAILIFLLVSLFRFGQSKRVFEEPRARSALGFGLLLGLVVLARLDTVFILVALAAATAIEIVRGPERPARAATRFAWICLGAALLVAPYLLSNRMTTGHWMPISGLLKSSFPAISRGGSLLERFGVRHLAFLAVGLAALVTLAPRAFRSRGGGPAYVDASLCVGALAMILHALHSYLFMTWAVFRWHFIWYGLLAIVALARASETLLALAPAPSRRLVHAAAAALLLATGAYESYRREIQDSSYNWHRAAYDAASWARAHTPEHAMFAMHDAGVFAYFSQRAVINLDGVVNDLEYQERLRERHLRTYLANNHVGYLVSHEAGKTMNVRSYTAAHLRVLSRLYSVWSDALTLRRSDEVYRGPIYRLDRRYDVACIIWRLEPEDSRAARRSDPAPRVDRSDTAPPSVLAGTPSALAAAPNPALR